MKKIDIIDKKILYELEKNSRQPYSKIAKKVHLSKNSIGLRIKKLEENGVIKRYFTYIDNYKLGFLAIRGHFTFKDVTPAIEKKIFDFLIDNKHTFLVARTYGFFDLSVIFMIKDIHDFFNTWEKINEKFGYYFRDKRISFFNKEIHYRLTYLLMDDKKKDLKREFDVCGGGNITYIDSLDFKILTLLDTNSRIPLKEISNKLNKSINTISSRIRNLEKNEIIRRYGIIIDTSKLGYKSYKAYLRLNSHTNKHKIIQYIRNNPHLYIIDFTTGESDIELEFHFQQESDIFNTIGELSNTFPDDIMYYNHATISVYRKLRFIPQLLHDK